MKIEIFKPLEFKKTELDISKLNRITDKEWIYASNGKSALYHCLKSLGVKGNILLPAYVCSSVLVPIKKLGLNAFFYDINSYDLNADYNDIEKKIEFYHINCVIVASMYGNPASLDKIESLCKKNNIYLIDDAAQCFGATLNQKFVGTFGNAGFFSFSPGKPTAGHMGAFFWTENKNYKVERTSNKIFHLLSYYDFYFNRLKIYNYKKYKVFILLRFIKNYYSKFIDLTNDDISPYDKKILGGVLKANEDISKRKFYLKKFLNGISNIITFKVITNAEEGTNNHKIVLLFDTNDQSKFYRNKLSKFGIYCSNGYKLLSEHLVPAAVNINGRVVEIPLETDEQKIKYLIDSIITIDTEINSKNL